MRKRDKKEIFTRAATTLFSQKGYTETSIKEIGKEAGLTISLFYHYFKDKEEILYTIIERAIRDLTTVLKEIQSKEPDPVECMKKMISRHIVYLLENKEAAKVTAAETGQLRNQRKIHCLNYQREIYDIFMNQLQHLDKLNLLADIDLTVVNFSIIGMINWFSRWYRPGKRLNEEDVAHSMNRIILSGILKVNPDRKDGA